MNTRYIFMALAALFISSVQAYAVESEQSPAAPINATLSRRGADCDQYNSYTFNIKVIGGQAGNCAAPNTKLTTCSGFDSPDQHYYIVQQNDGNLVAYHHGDHAVLWASRQNGHTGVYTIFQDDGNLVQYDQFGTALWASGTQNTGASWACIQDDGNFVIYGSSGNAIWFLFDGNWVLQH